jgi:hypothetical protein
MDVRLRGRHHASDSWPELHRWRWWWWWRRRRRYRLQRAARPDRDAPVSSASALLNKRHRAQNGHLRQPPTWAKPDILRILKSPVYAGYMAAGDELFDAEHPPLLDAAAGC